MNNRKIVTALAIVVLLGGALFVLRQRAPRGWEPVEWSVPVIDELQKIEIVSDGSGAETIVLERNAARWEMAEPLPFPSDPNRVDAIVNAFEEPIVVDLSREAARSGSGLGFGPDDRVYTVRLYDTTGVVFHARIGSTQTIESTSRTPTWVWPDGSDTIYRVGADLRDLFARPATEFRDKQILDLDSDSVTGITLRSGETTVELTKADDVWTATQPEGTTVDTTLVNRIVTGLARMRALEFADGVTAEQAGITDASPRITFRAGDESFTAILGSEVPATGDESDSEDVYVAREGTDAVFIVRKSTGSRIGSELGDIQPRSVLDLAESDVLALNFTDGQGRLIQIEPAPVVESEDGSGDDTGRRQYRVVAPERIDAPDSAVVGRVVRNVIDVEAARFPSRLDDASSGLDRPVRSFAVQLGDGSSHRLLLGGLVNQPAEEGAQEARYARVDDGRIFELAKYKVEALMVELEDLRPEAEGAEEGE